MTRISVWKTCTLLLAFPVFVLLTGCPGPATSVLEGTWRVQAEGAQDLNELLLTFNSAGQVTRVEFQLAGGSVITVNAPVGSATVSGENVTISTLTFNGNTLSFTGTLNSENTVITGTINLHIVVGGVTISTSGTPATLTKQ